MIVEALLNLVKGLLILLLTPIQIPPLPEGVVTTLEAGTTYMIDGLSIFAAFTHYQYIFGLLAVVLIIQAAMLLYKFVMWIIKKIPLSMD